MADTILPRRVLHRSAGLVSRLGRPSPSAIRRVFPLAVLALVLVLILLGPARSLVWTNQTAQPSGKDAVASTQPSPLVEGVAPALEPDQAVLQIQVAEDEQGALAQEQVETADEESVRRWVPPVIPVEPTPVPPILHRVRRDETLSEIAEMYGFDWLTVAKYNGLANPNRLDLGQILEIPPTDRAIAAARGDQRPPLQGPLTVLDAVYRSQNDGSRYSESNCGPAALGMFLAAFGDWYTTEGLRESVNEYMGIWSPDAGSTWEALAYAAEVRGYQPVGLYDESGEYYRAWTIDELVAEVRDGRPVMLLTHLRSLPGQQHQIWTGDHYILFLGLDENDDVIYHDPAFRDQGGSFLVMSQERLLDVWTNTAGGKRRTAMALRPIAP